MVMVMERAMGKKIRVIVVDDSALMRSLLAEIINRQSDMECIGTANDPLVAREMIRERNPDVVTLDVEMPRMDGIDFLGRLMRLRPMPVVMISTLTERGAEVTMRALELGAVDFVAKPRVGLASGLSELATQIVDKIRVAAVAQVRRAPARVGEGGAHAPAGVPEGLAERFWRVASQNITRLDDLAGWWDIFANGAEPQIDPEDAEFIAQAMTLLPPPPYDDTTWSTFTTAVKEATGRKGKGLFMPLRKALTGQAHGPEMADVMPLLQVVRARD